MSFLDNLFAPKQKPAEQPQQPQQQQQMQQQQKPADTGQMAAAAEAKQQNGMDDKLKDIWSQQEAKPKHEERLFNPNIAEFESQVGKMDFMKKADPAKFEAALGGDKAALMDLLNEAGRSSFAQASLTSQELIERAMADRTKDLDAMIEKKMRSLTASQTALKSNPAFADPQVAPLVGMVQSKLQAKHPDATPDELANLAQDFLVGIADKIKSGSPSERAAAEKQQQKLKASATDWEDWATT